MCPINREFFGRQEIFAGIQNVGAAIGRPYILYRISISGTAAFLLLLW